MDKIKFVNIDIIYFMEQIVQVHTRYYQSDLEIDKEMLREAASNQDQQDKAFIWLCRTAGTWLLPERDVFLKGTSANNIFNFYVEQASDPVLVYAVRVKSVVTDTVIGDIYVLDYQAHCRHIQSVGLAAKIVILQYERGERMMSADTESSYHPDMEYGKLVSIRYLPHMQADLEDLLWREWHKRGCFKEEAPDTYIGRLIHTENGKAERYAG